MLANRRDAGNARNRRRIQEQALYPHKFRRYLSLFFLCLVIVFVGFVHIRAVQTSDWSDTRLLGFSQISVCDNPTSAYVVMKNVSVNVMNSPVGITASCLYMEYGSNAYICITSYSIIEHITDPAFADIFVNSELDVIFPVAKEDKMFPYDMWILVFSVYFLVSDHFIDRPAQSPQVLSSKVLLRRVNYMVGIVIGLMLMFSAQQFCTMRSLYCNPNNAPSFFCEDLAYIGIEVKSVVYPTDQLVQYYSTICLLLSCAILFSTILRSFLPDGNNPSAVYTEDDVEDSRLARARNRNRDNNAVNALITFLYHRREGPLAADDDDDDIETIELPSTQNWKFFKYTPDSSTLECAICLGRFLVEPGLTIDSLDENDSDMKMKNKPQASEVTVIGIPATADTSYPDPTLDETFTPRESSNPEASIVQIPCGHIFHRTCILNWTLETATRERQAQRVLSCPICRSSLV